LFELWRSTGLVTQPFGRSRLTGGGQVRLKVSNAADDLLRESAFCLIPAAPVANYLDIDDASGPSMTVDRAGRWAVIVEGANTYSPDPTRRQARARLERQLYRQRGTLIATDYLVNSGGVIFAAQEQIIRTPDALRIPEAMLGDRRQVAEWIERHAEALQALAAERRQAGETYRDRVIRGNMRELIDLLLEDVDRLPCEAAERISIRRIAAGESERTAADVMGEISLVAASTPLQQAAAALVECGCPLMAVVDERQQLAGVITEWDFVRATAAGTPPATPIEGIMTRQVVTAAPGDSLLEILRRLEQYEYSALPVVDAGRAIGVVSSDLLATRSLTRLLQGQAAER
jgi:glutamate dehydrogenase (NAD(P)+)